MYCKKVMEKLCVMMKATLKRLAKHFQAAAVETGTEVELHDNGPLFSEGDIIFVLETYLRWIPMPMGVNFVQESSLSSSVCPTLR